MAMISSAVLVSRNEALTRVILQGIEGQVVEHKSIAHSSALRYVSLDLVIRRRSALSIFCHDS
jgi:hypothetical protein